ncbi:MAG: hypothetical protein ACREAE_01140 [Nitrosopumilaceae archaeon]
MKNPEKRILIEGSGGPAGIGFCRSLRIHKPKFWILGTDINPYYLIRSVVDKQVFLSKMSEKKYVNRLNKLIDDYKIDFIHPQPDQSVRLISKNRKKLKCSLFLPDDRTVLICQNKFLSYKKWMAAGLNTPETYLIRTPKDLKESFERLGKDMWIREIHGTAGKNSLPTNNLETARVWIDFHNGWGRFTVAKKLSSDSITWSSIWKDGELVVAQGRKRLYWEFGNRTLSGITGLTGGSITKADPEVDKISQEAIYAIDKNPNGIFSVDMTYDQRGHLNLTEINIGRFFTTIEFFARAGLNIPLIYTSLALDLKIPKIKKILNPLPDNLCWIRGIDIEPIMTTLDDVERVRSNKFPK